MMATTRRRVLRPPRTAVEDSLRQQKLTRKRDQLQKEQAGLAHWMTRLRRAFHAMEKQQLKVSCLERDIARLG